jgi:hypothetical protein
MCVGLRAESQAKTRGVRMGLWSSIKKTVKKVAKKAWRAVKAVVRVVVRIVVAAVTAAIHVFDLLLGFLTWPPKKLRVQIFILSGRTTGSVVGSSVLTPAIDFAKNTFKDKLNVKLLPYSKNMIEIIKEPAPAGALDVGCSGGGAWSDEYLGEAGEYFADHLAGWNAVPVSGTFPVTVFVVQNVRGKRGCSMGPLTDYITIDVDGASGDTTLAHEIGHACNLWHSKTQSNLMFKNFNRGNGVKWFQKNLFRNSRHVTYW